MKENDFFYHGTYLKGMSGRRALSSIVPNISHELGSIFVSFHFPSGLRAVFLDTGH